MNGSSATEEDMIVGEGTDIDSGIPEAGNISGIHPVMDLLASLTQGS